MTRRERGVDEDRIGRYEQQQQLRKTKHQTTTTTSALSQPEEEEEHASRLIDKKGIVRSRKWWRWICYCGVCVCYFIFFFKVTDDLARP
jgi:hypothetical protein